jgi:TrmH family RNA methyltransferase
VAPDITSSANDRVKWLVRLRDRSTRDQEGLFVVEGDRLYQRALGAGLTPVITFVAEGADVATIGDTVTVDTAALDKASYRQQSEDVIGVFPQLDTNLGSLPGAGTPLILVAEDVEKPGNLGAMLRSAAAAGADALVTVGAGVDPHNPNVVRASTGALFEVPLAVSNWDDLDDWLSRHGVRTVCASPSASEVVWDVDLSGPLALVVGSEDDGLSPRALVRADQVVLIPQVNAAVDSLNVSVAAAILLFEARRQRRDPLHER